MQYLVLLVFARVLFLPPLLFCLLDKVAMNLMNPGMQSPYVECGTAHWPCSCCQFSQNHPHLPF